MKAVKISLLTLMLAAVPVSYTASTSVKTTIDSLVDKFVAWNATTIDVGTIPQGTPKTIKFEFVNKTNKPVLITNVKPSCGCTAADYTTTAIKPKGKGYVNATYNAATEGGFSKTVTVTTSDNPSPTTLTFKGVVAKK